MLDNVVRTGEMAAVRAERALRMASSAGGIDDERRVVGRELRRQCFKLCNRRLVVRGGGVKQGGEACQLVVPVREHGARIDDHDMAQLRQPFDQRQYLVDVFLVLGDDDARAAVAQLVFGFRGRRGRIDAVGERAKRLRRQVREHPFLTRIADDRDALAALEAEPCEPFGDAPHQRGVLAPGAFAIDAELLGTVGNSVRRLPRARGEQPGRRFAAQLRSARRKRGFVWHRQRAVIAQ